LWILLKGALLEQVLVRRCKSSPRKRGKRARIECEKRITVAMNGFEVVIALDTPFQCNVSLIFLTSQTYHSKLFNRISYTHDADKSRDNYGQEYHKHAGLFVVLHTQLFRYHISPHLLKSASYRRSRVLKKNILSHLHSI
jgi:hypothetical protein